MNKISNEEINKIVNERYNDLISYYPKGKNRILGVFVTGAANYNFAESLDDLRLNAVYLPTFEELCTTVPSIESFYKDVRILDVRHFYHMSNFDDSGLGLELLFCNNYKINPIYDLLFKERFLYNRETIAHYDEQMRISKAYKRALKAIEKENYFEALRLQIAAEIYLRDRDNSVTDDCYHLKHEFQIELLEQAKSGIYIPSVERINYSFKRLLNEASIDIDFEAKDGLKQGIVDLVSAAMQRDEAAGEKFIAGLSGLEKEIFILIYRKVKEGGFISIKKLIEENKGNFSRAAVQSLFDKMKVKRIANIVSHGVKGYSIEFFTNDFGDEMNLLLR